MSVILQQERHCNRLKDFRHCVAREKHLVTVVLDGFDRVDVVCSCVEVWALNTVRQGVACLLLKQIAKPCAKRDVQCLFCLRRLSYFHNVKTMMTFF